MKKYLAAFYLLGALLITLPTLKAQEEDVIAPEDVIIEDDIIADGDVDAQTVSVTLAWAPNPERNIGGYNVYYGFVSGDYLRFKAVTETKVTLKVRAIRTIYFAVTAFNTDGLESDFSAEVSYP